MSVQLLFEQMNEKLQQLWTDNHTKTKEEVSQILHTLLTKSAESLNLVTREEFEETRTALERAQQQLAQLEQKISELESSPAKSEGD